MKIVGIDVIPLRAELSTPRGPSILTYKRRETLFIKVTTDSGLVGWGETYRLAGVEGTLRDVLTPLLIAQSQLQAVGIKADFQPLERGPLLEAITGRKFDLVSYGGGVYSVDPDSTSYVLMCQFTQPKGANNAGYCNEQVDRLFVQGRATADQAARAKIYQEASALINDDVSHVWLFVADAIYGYSDKLQGLKPHGDFNSAYWNANEWSVTG